MNLSNRIRTDWRLFMAILMILTFGLVMVYSASSVPMDTRYAKPTWYYGVRQLVFALLGLMLMLIIKRIDYLHWKHPIWAFVPLGVVITMLIGVIFVDRSAHRWYSLWGFMLQPSEFAKPALIVFLAYFVARRKDDINGRHTLGPAALVVLGIAGLVGYGDLGTAIIIMAPAAVIFFVAGIEKRYFYASLALGALLFAGAIKQRPDRLLRMLSYVGITQQTLQQNPHLQFLLRWTASSDAQGNVDHQPKQAKIAVATGHWLGAGVGNGVQKMGFLPEASSDSMFGVVAEEVGFIGCLVLLCGYLFVFWRGLRLYWITSDVFGKYLALGVVSLVTVQALFNISVVVGLAPTKGIPLPLISYGGSALMCTLVTFGFLLSVSERSI